MRVMAQGVRVSFGERKVLTGVTLTAGTGEAVAVVGASGSGKSTLLAVLGGLLRPDEGLVWTEPATTRINDHVAWVTQSPSLLPHRTAFENAALPLSLSGDLTAETADQVRQTLATMGLAGTADKRARFLSGGEQQRVTIARCSLSGRPIVLADEPTGQLDRATSLMVTDLLLGLRDSALVVIATHDLDVARACDRILDLQHGSAS